MNSKALTNPWFVMLVGMPATGKTTFIKNLKQPHVYVVLSTDRYIDLVANAQRKTYNEIFKDTIEEAQGCLEENFKHALKYKKNIIHDQTNLSRNKRLSVLERIPDSYYKVCIVFECKQEEWEKRLVSRPGKVIPQSILDSMCDRFQLVSVTEGFDDVIFYNSSSV